MIEKVLVFDPVTNLIIAGIWTLWSFCALCGVVWVVVKGSKKK